MAPRICISLGAWIAGLAVMLGAFGAHLLKEQLPKWYPEHGRSQEMSANWETAVRYQMYSSIGLIAAGLWAAQRLGRRPTWPGVLFLAGTLLFSGMLYAFVLTEAKPLVIFVPFGGLAMIAGWLLFAWQVLWEKQETT